MRFFLDDKPEHLTVTQWITGDRAFKRLSAKVRPRRKYPHSMIVPGPHFDLNLLAAQVAARVSDVNTNQLFPQLDYHTCRGITAHYLCDSDVDRKTLFYDRMGYTLFAKIIWGDTEVERIHRQSKRTLLNCSVSRIHAHGTRPLRWTAIHRDAPLAVESRLIISLNTHPEFEIQHLDRWCRPTGFKLDSFGSTYTFDSSKYHRAYFTKQTGNHRTCVLLGFSPWFDYDSELRCWTANEFYGELHPFDIMANGHVF